MGLTYGSIPFCLENFIYKLEYILIEAEIYFLKWLETDGWVYESQIKTEPIKVLTLFSWFLYLVNAWINV